MLNHYSNYYNDLYGKGEIAYFKSQSRNGITHASGPNYWDFHDFPKINNYSRHAISCSCSDTRINVAGFIYNDSYIRVSTYNFSGQTVNNLILGLVCLYTKNSIFGE